MRPQRFIRNLTEIERQDIKKLFHHPSNNRDRKRAQAIRLSAMGYMVIQTVEILGCNRQERRLCV